MIYGVVLPAAMSKCSRAVDGLKSNVYYTMLALVLLRSPALCLQWYNMNTHVPGAMSKCSRAVDGLTPGCQARIWAAEDARWKNFCSSSRWQPRGSFLARRRCSSTGSLSTKPGGGRGITADTWTLASPSLCGRRLSTLDTAAVGQQSNTASASPAVSRCHALSSWTLHAVAITLVSIKEVALRWARLLLAWVQKGKPSRHITNHQDPLSLPPSPPG